jgi:predicted MPP superfamily phosphohydrolase
MLPCSLQQQGQTGCLKGVNDLIWWLFLILLSATLLYAYWNTFRPVLREVKLNIAGKEGLHDLTIVQLSDLHMERQSISPKRLCDMTASANPDLIVLTGDYLDRHHNIDRFLEYLKLITPLNPQYGIYLVFGNHDHYLGEQIDEFQKLIEAAGCRVLRNESASIQVQNTTLHIIGIDDYCLGKSDIPRSYDNVPADGIHLVLAHDPNTVLALDKRHPADYILSGHFHGGQFNLIPYLHRVMGFGELPKQDILKGMHQVNGKTLYISEGLGQSGLNVRLGSRPEITVHRLSTGKLRPAAESVRVELTTPAFETAAM